MYSQSDEKFSLEEAHAMTGTTRAAFIRKVYTHLAGAVLGFIALEALYFSTPIAATIFQAVAGVPWLLILGAFVVFGWIARSVAHRSTSRTTQYAALAGYVVLESLIFVPLLVIAISMMEGSFILIQQAGIITGLLFAGLTATVFITRADFSFLKSILTIGGFIALGTIVAGVIFGFDLGLWFSAAMVLLAAGAILYDTSKILHHYDEDGYVGASLELFASVALLFWYVLRILTSLANRG